MNIRTSIRPTAGRTTYVLNGTASTSEVKLDFKSRLALAWIERWIAEQQGLKAPMSGVIRHALQVYVRHLESLPADAAPNALQGLKSACSALSPSPDERKAARARLEASGAPLPPFEVILKGQHRVDADAAFMARLAELSPIPTKAKSNE